MNTSIFNIFKGDKLFSRTFGIRPSLIVPLTIRRPFQLQSLSEVVLVEGVLVQVFAKDILIF